jgi:hypothetical protein
LPRRRTTLQSRWRFFADLSDDNTFMERLATVSERGKRGIVREFVRQWKSARVPGRKHARIPHFPMPR